MRVACPHCGGSGVIADFLPEICFLCEGDGVVDREPDDRPDVPMLDSPPKGGPSDATSESPRTGKGPPQPDH